MTLMNKIKKYGVDVLAGGICTLIIGLTVNTRLENKELYAQPNPCKVPQLEKVLELETEYLQIRSGLTSSGQLQATNEELIQYSKEFQEVYPRYMNAMEPVKEELKACKQYWEDISHNQALQVGGTIGTVAFLLAYITARSATKRTSREIAL